MKWNPHQQLLEWRPDRSAAQNALLVTPDSCLTLKSLGVTGKKAFQLAGFRILVDSVGIKSSGPILASDVCGGV
jgi:hypothetical protein